MQSPQAVGGEVLLNRTMMEANTAVGRGGEERAPRQRLSFRWSPLGKDRRGIENAVRTVTTECLIGRLDAVTMASRAGIVYSAVNPIRAASSHFLCLT